MIQEDTISAIATAAGEAGIGIVRISGEHAIGIVDKIFKSANGKKLAKISDRSVTFGRVFDSNDNIIDEAIVLIMRSPRSYTREDVVEIQCHGSNVALQKILSRTLEAGARLAERGEFTKRAFLNGRLNLSQAQAVLDIIQAKTNESLMVAENKLYGLTKNRIYELKHQILNIITHIEAIIDFPEDDIEEITLNEIELDINKAIAEIDSILISETKGTILREGIETAIIGRPNVGKSSLLNLLSNREKAIVTEIPGTTRDIIEEFINVGGIPLKIVDTAGIHNSTDKIEKIGIEKTKAYIQKSSLILALFDGSRKLELEDEEIFELVKNRNLIILITKSDLPQKLNLQIIRDYFPMEKIISISVKSQSGIEELRRVILEKILGISNELNFVKTERELEILRRIKNHLEASRNTLKSNMGIDLISIDLRSALQAIDEWTGESVDEDIINEIFSKFCIGK